MLNILRYNLYRLSRLKVAYVFLALSVILGLGIGALTFMSTIMSGISTIMPMEVSVVFMGIIISLFFTTEFKDGMVRDQLIMGNSHSAIYIADSISACICGSIMWLAYIVPYLVLMAILGMSFSALGVVLGLLSGLLSVWSACCVYVFVSFQTKNAHGIIVCILVPILLSIFATIMSSPLATLGVIKEPTLSILVTCLKALPISQLTFVETFATTNIWIVFLSSVLVIAMLESIGILLFKKSDIK